MFTGVELLAVLPAGCKMGLVLVLTKQQRLHLPYAIEYVRGIRAMVTNAGTA